MSKADKELQFYREKAEFADQITKIEERRERKAGREEQSESEDQGNSGGEDDKVHEKKRKNMDKIIKYH